MATTEIDLRKLSADELAVYHEQGYVIVPDVFPLQELAEIDREIDRIQETEKKNRAQQRMGHAVGIAIRCNPSICAGRAGIGTDRRHCKTRHFDLFGQVDGKSAAFQRHLSLASG